MYINSLLVDDKDNDKIKREIIYIAVLQSWLTTSMAKYLSYIYMYINDSLTHI